MVCIAQLVHSTTTVVLLHKTQNRLSHNISDGEWKNTGAFFRHMPVDVKDEGLTKYVFEA